MLFGDNGIYPSRFDGVEYDFLEQYSRYHSINYKILPKLGY